MLKSKIEKLTWVDSVTTIIDVPLKSTNESLMERLGYKTLAYPEIDEKEVLTKLSMVQYIKIT